MAFISRRRNMKAMKLLTLLLAQLHLACGFRISAGKALGQSVITTRRRQFPLVSSKLTLNNLLTSVRPMKLKMSLDVHTLQNFIHEIPTWAQYAAQGISEEAIAG